MKLIGIHQLRQNTQGIWEVVVDDHRIPFPSLSMAKGYFQYIRTWANAGEVISYDSDKETLFWIKVPNVRAIESFPFSRTRKDSKE